MRGQNRQEGYADSGADHPQRQLLEPIGIIEPGDGTVADQRNQYQIDGHIDLVNSGTEHSRRNAFKQRDNFRIFD